MALCDTLKGPVAVLAGGESAEREVSLQSGSVVLNALSSQGIDAIEVDPAQSGWQTRLSGVAVAFIALHGPGGEDGSMQGALQNLGLPYTGAGVLGSALAMDKLRSKQLWRGIGLPTADFSALNENTNWQQVIDQLGKVFVKPSREGSSIGMRSADCAQSLEQAYRMAREYGADVIAEQLIEGPEYTVAVLGEDALPAIKLETDNEFYDYEAKYLADDTRYLCPCGLNAQEEAEIARLSLRAFESLGCSVWGRVDLMRDAQGEFQLLEVNTVPGMTSHSLVPMAADAAGLDIGALVARIVELSLQEVR